MTAPARANTRHLPILAFGGDLIGRETECAAIAAWLNHPRRRLLTITGPGGVGKTHLAYHALQTAPASHRVIFVSLAPIATGDLLMPALCHAMRLDERSGAPLLDLIAGAIGDGPVVLALDNLEHLPEARFTLMTGYVPAWRARARADDLSRCLSEAECAEAERFTAALGLRSAG